MVNVNLGFVQEDDKQRSDNIPLQTVSATAPTNKQIPNGDTNTLVNDSTENDTSEERTEDKSTNLIVRARSGFTDFVRRHKKAAVAILQFVLFVGYFVYFGYVLYLCDVVGEGSCTEEDWRLAAIAAIIVLVFFAVIGKRCGVWKALSRTFGACFSTIVNYKYSTLIFFGVVTVGLFGYIIADAVFISGNTENLQSFAGVFSIWLIGLLISKHPGRVNYRTVYGGFLLQVVFCLIVLKTEPGRKLFDWLGKRVREFLDHTIVGSQFVFGDLTNRNILPGGIFAVDVFPVIVYFSAVTSVLFYLGWVQALTRALARLMQATLQSAPAESLNAAANIFLGMTEAPLLIRPFLPRLSVSELHAVFTGGFATIAGSVMAVYLIMGIPPGHLITACIMAAPGALSLTKLVYPETEVNQLTIDDIETVANDPQDGEKPRNILDAAASGASVSISLVANIAVNLIAFLAMLDFIDATLQWFGARAGLVPPDFEPLSFNMLSSYVFWPVALVMGVAPVDCRQVAKLLGLKVFVNEFVAFSTLQQMMKNADKLAEYKDEHFSGTWAEGTEPDRLIGGAIFLPATNETLGDGVMERSRSENLSTYAVCGFANLGAMGISLGALGAMAPTRRSTMSKIVFSALITANMVNLMSASIAGLVMDNERRT